MNKQIYSFKAYLNLILNVLIKKKTPKNTLSINKINIYNHFFSLKNQRVQLQRTRSLTPETNINIKKNSNISSLL